MQWEMKGIDVHLDTDIGKRFTLLGHTLTLLAGEGEEELMGGDIDTDGLLNGLGRDGKDGVDGKDGEDEDDVLSSPDTQGNSLEVILKTEFRLLFYEGLKQSLYRQNMSRNGSVDRFCFIECNICEN